MDYTDTDEVRQFRADLRAWLAANRSSFGSDSQPAADLVAATLEWYRTLAAAGYVAVSLPAEYGGRGLPDMFEAVVNEELAIADAPPPPPIGHIAHALADFGTQELKSRFLPGLLSCAEPWCQGFSEPGAGSDLAGIATTAAVTTVPGGGSTFRVNGRKIWTSGAMWSRWCLLLARTEPGQERHRGLSMLVVDLESAGIERREITMSTGSREFAEVFFDDVEVPAENLVGARGQGWAIAMSMLSYERGPADMGWVGRIGRVVARACSEVREGRVAADEVMRRELTAGWVGLQVLQWHVQRSLASRQYRAPGAEGSIDKLLATRVEQQVYRTLADLAGPSAVLDDLEQFRAYLYSRAQSIYGGTQQIQRSIVAQRLLGLPRA
jgi:alkylation response protein AidB-like acyl-CoA dehydrogenase